MKTHNLPKKTLQSPPNKSKHRVHQKGITLTELIVAVGIIGILAVILYPSVQNSMETRSLENTMRDIQTTMSRARYQAAKMKLNHRVIFQNQDGRWRYWIEIQDTGGNWSIMEGFIRKTISSSFSVNVDFPGQTVVFSPLGLISNFDAQHTSITLTSAKIQGSGYPSRNLSVFAGGSLQYTKL